MYIEKFLKQFWRCVDMGNTGDDKFVCEAFYFKEKLTNKNIILSGMKLEYDIVKPGVPAFLSFDMWDLRADELNPDYWQTGHVHEFKPIKNGFIVITGNDEKGSTTYTFKKTKFNPLLERYYLRKRIVEIENGNVDLQEHDLIEG